MHPLAASYVALVTHRGKRLVKLKLPWQPSRFSGMLEPGQSRAIDESGAPDQL